ncbi:MAG TPA: LPS assembly protein LptD [Candidatus Binataceae bacterium]|nr:LPS assembly protein LptD [Candidatus Binataceae bacterium]
MFAAGALAASAARAQNQTSLILQAHHGPVDVTARRFEYDYKTDTFVATGDAVVTQAASTLSADRIELLRRQHRAAAYGNVHLNDPLGDLFGSEAKVDYANETAELTDGKLIASNHTYRLSGKKIYKLLGQRYKVTDGFFTTCGCGGDTPDWSISGADIDVHVGDKGVARNAHFDVLGHPVIPLPYAIFPTDTSRSSGFLSPRVGTSGLRGFQYVQPFYWAIDKSSDFTIASDVETKMRVGALAEYRLQNGDDDYLRVDGAFMDESLRSQASRVGDVIDNQIADPHIPINRYDIIGTLRQHLTPELTAYADAISVSDSLYLREMNIWTLSRGFGNSYNTMRNAPADFGVIDSFENGFARLGGVWNQDLIQPQEFALQTLPELLVSGRKELFGGFAYADYNLQADNFWRSEGVTGTRLDLNPQLTVPWRLGDYLYGWGGLGMHETVYDVSGHEIAVTPVGTQGLKYNNALSRGVLEQGGMFSRELPYANFGASTIIERIYDVNWKSISKLKHTIEPFVYYNFVPNIDQNDLPLFDEIDRINGRSLLTYGATSRIFIRSAPQVFTNDTSAGESDEEQPVAAAGVGPKAGMVRQIAEFQLLQAYDTSHAVAKGGSRWSDLQATAFVTPPGVSSSIGSQLGYDPRENRISYSSVYLTLQPPGSAAAPSLYMGRALMGSFLQISYNYIAPGPSALEPGVNSNFFEFFTLRAYYDLFDRLGVFVAPSYDIVHGKLLSAEYGVRVKSPCNCWAVDVGVTKSTNPDETAVQFMVTLGGIGSVGQNPFGRSPFQHPVGPLPGLY